MQLQISLQNLNAFNVSEGGRGGELLLFFWVCFFYSCFFLKSFAHITWNILPNVINFSLGLQFSIDLKIFFAEMLQVDIN